jgi:hypothetical protein
MITFSSCSLVDNAHHAHFSSCSLFFLSWSLYHHAFLFILHFCILLLFHHVHFYIMFTLSSWLFFHHALFLPCSLYHHCSFFIMIIFFIMLTFHHEHFLATLCNQYCLCNMIILSPDHLFNMLTLSPNANSSQCSLYSPCSLFLSCSHCHALFFILLTFSSWSPFHHAHFFMVFALW